jgi:2-oxo-hept-3-ene-1,7-dioate hydratase
MEMDLRWIGVLRRCSNVTAESGVGATILNHSANDAARLANKHAPFPIAPEPGQFVVGGSFTANCRGPCRRHLSDGYTQPDCIRTRFA